MSDMPAIEQDPVALEPLLVTADPTDRFMEQATTLLAWAVAQIVLAPIGAWAIMLLVPLVAEWFGVVALPGYGVSLAAYLLLALVIACLPRK